MNRSEKEQIISAMKEKVLRSKSLFLADFTGITVEQITELRREFRKSHVDYHVVKNTLARKALESIEGYDKVLDKLESPTAIAFGYDDPVAPARIIKKFRDKHEKLAVKACVIETQVFEGKDLDRLAKLPSRGELVAGILGSIQSPIAGLAGAVGAVMRDLVYIIDAIEKKKAA
ncbi:MAG: 50S ribosomal protein L10 [Ignavibacteria bacterium]|nr:MAG: 50S ribosomal protein L10 [Ignavibacteria bacterium]